MENFLNENAEYIVLGVSILLWLGFSGYMFYLDRKITTVENSLSFNEKNDKEL